MSEYLPDDVLVKILTYLPAKSLVRFTSVCKSWQTLITSSNFITDHLNRTKLSDNNNNNNNNNHLLLLRYCPRIHNNDGMSLYVDNNDTFDLYESVDYPFPSGYHVLGSGNGLILLSNDLVRKNTLMLWNPSIRKSMTLPCPRFMYSKDNQAFGFGFDSRTNDYKVVRLVYRRLNWNVTPKVDIYKLSTGSWETITPTFDPSCFIYLAETFMNGAVYWRACKNRVFLIMSFNVSDEKFLEIMPPADLNVKIGFDIAICGEWLSLFHTPDSRICSVWVMKEYGVVESWTKLYTLDLMEAKLKKPLGFRKNGELMLTKFDGEVVSYDSGTQQIKYLGNFYPRIKLCVFLCPTRSYADPYVESLVLLGDANRLESGPSKEAMKTSKKRCFHQT